MKCPGFAAIAVLLSAAAYAQRVGAPTDDLSRVGVDELFSLEVTSVGRKAQEMSKAPGAIFVLTAEDIRRSGAVSLPEALRWVPGLTVLSADERSWVISARGAARLYSNKILVLVDGRSLYTPLFSGVIWDIVDVPLGDIERIEIVRGPGAVMWGPHAVNGVVNIITKKASQTKGARTAAASGNAVRGIAETRWGAALSDRIAYRVWGKLDYQTPAYGSNALYYLNTFTAVYPNIDNLNAATGRAGFRMDFEQSEHTQLMVQGDVYKRDRQEALGVPAMQPALMRSQEHTDYSGGFLHAKWTHTSAGGAETQAQFSYDKTELDYPYIHGNLNNLNFDIQRRVQTSESNEIYFGAGYQQYWDTTWSQNYVGFNPANSMVRSTDVVFRDEWQIVPSRLTASAGIRLDHSSYSRLDYQPSFRLLYTPDARHSAWIAASRAVRTPDRFDRAITADNGTFMAGLIPIHQSMQGSPDFQAEIERSLEAGYRMQSGQRWSIDTSAFWSRYSRLRSVSASPVLVIGPQSFYVDAVAQIGNQGTGTSYGGEIWSTLQVLPAWRLMPGYSYTHELFQLPASSPTAQNGWDRQPSDLRHQGMLRSRHDLSRKWQLDLMARVRDRDRAFGLPGVLLFDARLGWQLSRGAEISLTGHNLTNRQVIEAIVEGAAPSIPVRRTALIQWTQRF
jgi:iron complex outermembrane receptor protein